MSVGSQDTFSSRSPSLGVALGCGVTSSVSRPVSSISVVSVPFDDGAIGEGSEMSLGLDVNGEDWFGGCRKLAWSAGLAKG